MSTSVHDGHLSFYLEETVRRSPRSGAVVAPDGTSITFSELDALVDSVTRYLQAHKVGRADRVGVMLPKTVESVAVIQGVLRAGAACVPIDPHGPITRSRQILADCGVRVVFAADQTSAEAACTSGGGAPDIVALAPDGRRATPYERECATWSDVLAYRSDVLATPPRESSDLAYILYTSGSTGSPKGVVLTHENVVSFVEWSAETFRPTGDDRFASLAPFHFDLSIFDLFVSAKRGACVFLVPADLLRQPRHLARYAAEKDLTVWYSTPSLLALLAQYGDLDRLQYGGPRLVLFAGEIFPLKHLKRVTSLWPAARWYNLYGPTETNVCTFARVPTPIDEGRSEPFPIGRMCSHCEGLVLDEEKRASPPGSVGTLHVAGPSVFQGYWNRPEESELAFNEVEGRRFYDTGDLVRLDPTEGMVFLGRRDRMIKHRGYRVELGEIEHALYEHSSLREVAVVTVPHSDRESELVACVVAKGGPVSVIELKTFCSRRLPQYMIPDRFSFAKELPQTSTGKIDYRSLAVDLAG
jgi:amino acid adenylation domain-containing protein